MDMKEMAQVWMETKKEMETFVSLLKRNKLGVSGIKKFIAQHNLHMTDSKFADGSLSGMELKELAYQAANKVIGNMERMIAKVEAMV